MSGEILAKSQGVAKAEDTLGHGAREMDRSDRIKHRVSAEPPSAGPEHPPGVDPGVELRRADATHRHGRLT